MDEAWVKADATAVGQQGLGIGGHLRRCMAADPDIRRPSIQMLAVRAGMGDGMVIGGGAVAAVHKNRGIKVGPHLFQQLHQLWGDEQGSEPSLQANSRTRKCVLSFCAPSCVRE